MYTIHENDVEAKQLPGRLHKMVISPWHFGKSKNMSFGVAYFPPQSHAPEHLHAKEEEIIYFLSGYGEMFFNGNAETIKAGSMAYIPPNVGHSIKNKSPETMSLIYVFSPPVQQGTYDKK